MKSQFTRQTYVPEHGVVISTVGHLSMIGRGRTAETMIFPADSEGNISGWGEVAVWGHGMHPTEAELNREHERIVSEVRAGGVPNQDD